MFYSLAGPEKDINMSKVAKYQRNYIKHRVMFFSLTFTTSKKHIFYLQIKEGTKPYQAWARHVVYALQESFIKE